MEGRIFISDLHLDHSGKSQRQLQLHYEASVTLEVKRRRLFAAAIRYIVLTIWSRPFKLTERTTDASTELINRTMRRVLRLFLGLGYMFNRFIPEFDNLVTPENNQLWKTQPK